jgi:hypothetical protein
MREAACCAESKLLFQALCVYLRFEDIWCRAKKRNNLRKNLFVVIDEMYCCFLYYVQDLSSFCFVMCHLHLIFTGNPLLFTHMLFLLFVFLIPSSFQRVKNQNHPGLGSSSLYGCLQWSDSITIWIIWPFAMIWSSKPFRITCLRWALALEWLKLALCSLQTKNSNFCSTFASSHLVN